MKHRTLISIALLSIVFSLSASAQTEEEAAGPVTKSEVRSALEFTPETDEEIEKTNQELIEAVKERGVDFVLSKEEEWAFQLRDASDELIQAIRDAVSDDERAFRLYVRKQRSLYEAFANNYRSNDLASKQAAIDAGREFIAKYSQDEGVAEIVRYMQRAMPNLERTVRILERSTRFRRGRRTN